MSRFHEPVDLLGCLHARAHVVVVGEGHALLLRFFAEPVEALAELLPLLLREAGLGVEYGKVLALDGVALLGRPDHPGAHRVEEVAVRDELLLDLGVGLGGEKGGEPGVADGEAAEGEGLVEYRRIPRVLVAHLAAREAREGHLAHALLEGNLAAELGQVVVGPAYGRDRQPHFASYHISSPPK